MSAPVRQLGPAHADALRAFLARDAAHHLYLLGLLEEWGLAARPGAPGLAWWGHVGAGDALELALFVGGEGALVVPSAGPREALERVAAALAGRVRLTAALGEAELVDALVERLGGEGPWRVRSQRLYHVSADDMGPFTNPPLRPAREADVDALAELAAMSVAEGGAPDPRADAAGWAAFRERVLRRARAGRTWVLEEQGALVFKVDVGSKSRHGAELEAPFTHPAHRGRGHATLSLGQLCRSLLSSLPRLSLRVDEDARSLANVARRVGFVPGRPQRRVVAPQGR